MRAASILLVTLLSLGWCPELLGQTGAEALKDSNPKARRGAIQTLAKTGRESGDPKEREAAWDLVVEEGLTDPEPQVADEAQLQLGTGDVSEPRLQALDSKKGLRSRDELVRLRCVEALGRLGGDLPLELFQRAFGDKGAEVRAAAAYAMQLRLRAGPWPQMESNGTAEWEQTRRAVLKQASRDKDPMTRASFIELACNYGSSPIEIIDWPVKPTRAALESGEPLPMAAALRGLGRHVRMEDLVAALESSAPGVFKAAIEGLELRGNKAAMELAAQQVGGERSSAETARVVRMLQRVSGLSHGASPERWQRWAKELPKDWRASADPEDTKASKETDGGQTTAFFGLRIASERLVFLVDMSGSMWDEKNGTTRKAAVEVELAKALRGLPESASFNIVPYATTPAPWKGKPVSASPKNVASAIKAFERNTLRGQGDVWSALIPVLRDPGVDTVVILSDGAPSGGIRWNVELMRSLLAAENRHRGVVIHTVLFDARKGLQRLWGEISSDSGGTSVTIQ